MKLGAVLMASGSGRRFGSNKLFFPVDGVSLIDRAMEAVPAEFFSRAVVVSAYPSVLEAARKQGFTPVFNRAPEQGQSASVVLGTKKLLDMDGILFAVCDQPWLQRDSVARLLADFSADPGCIWALNWQGQRGNPVVFPKRFFPDLLALTGDKGGGVVIRKNPGLLRLTEAGSPRELQDIDTQADLAEHEKRQ